jgi:hypothetical protein
MMQEPVTENDQNPPKEGWMQWSVRWLKELALFAWLPALVVSCVSAYFAVLNYNLQTSGNRPELIYTRLVLVDPYEQSTLEMQLRNVGARPAHDLRILLGTTDVEAKMLVSLGTIVGSNLIPRDAMPAAQAKIDLKQFRGILIVCTQYSDAANNQYRDVAFHKIPNLKVGLTKEQGGGGEYKMADVLPEERVLLTKRSLCG